MIFGSENREKEKTLDGGQFSSELILNKVTEMGWILTKKFICWLSYKLVTETKKRFTHLIRNGMKLITRSLLMSLPSYSSPHGYISQWPPKISLYMSQLRKGDNIASICKENASSFLREFKLRKPFSKHILWFSQLQFFFENH